jgi:hypothetical protein
MPNPPIRKPLLETFLDILDISLDVLNNISNTGEDNHEDNYIVLAKEGIEKAKKDIDDYKKKKDGEVVYNTLENKADKD